MVVKGVYIEWLSKEYRKTFDVCKAWYKFSLLVGNTKLSLYFIFWNFNKFLNISFNFYGTKTANHILKMDI